MKTFAFELGRKSSLCLEELITLLGEKSFQEQTNNIAIFKLNENFDAQIFQDQVGGTIKIIEITSQIHHSSNLEKIKSSVKEIIENNFKGQKGKIPFSICTFNFQKHDYINIKGILNFSKKILKSLKLNSRFVNKNFKNPKPSTIFKAKILIKGIDLNIIKGKEKILLGKTLTIQDISSYSKRDYNKPRRDPKVGMLPPKLAQIMINLAGKTKTIYDPFCGTGTILMEGLLMNKTVVGSDNDPRMVDYTKQNCEWLQKEFKTKNYFQVFEKDAQTLTKNDIPENIDAIITEGFLGKAISTIPPKEERQKIFQELSDLHSKWLSCINKITPKNCPIIMCKTGFKLKDRVEHFPNFDQIAKNSGYNIIKKFIYSRPEQIVVRDIVILEKI